MKSNTRVYINAKRIGTRTHASSSATAATVRREGTLVKTTKTGCHIHFDDTPGVTTIVDPTVVFPVGAPVFRLCSYHRDSLGWDACTEDFQGCEVIEARLAGFNANRWKVTR